MHALFGTPVTRTQDLSQTGHQKALALLKDLKDSRVISPHVTAACNLTKQPQSWEDVFMPFQLESAETFNSLMCGLAQVLQFATVAPLRENVATTIFPSAQRTEKPNTATWLNTKEVDQVFSNSNWHHEYQTKKQASESDARKISNELCEILKTHPLFKNMAKQSASLGWVPALFSHRPEELIIHMSLLQAPIGSLTKVDQYTRRFNRITLWVALPPEELAELNFRISFQNMTVKLPLDGKRMISLTSRLSHNSTKTADNEFPNYHVEVKYKSDCTKSEEERRQTIPIFEIYSTDKENKPKTDSALDRLQPTLGLLLQPNLRRRQLRPSLKGKYIIT